jgi:hypothetical protein
MAGVPPLAQALCPRLRRIRRLAFIVAAVSNYYFQTFTPVLVLTVLWMPAYLVFGYRFVYWRCPRCNRPFSASFGYHKGMFCRACIHCGLRKYSNG